MLVLYTIIAIGGIYAGVEAIIKIYNYLKAKDFKKVKEKIEEKIKQRNK